MPEGSKGNVDSDTVMIHKTIKLRGGLKSTYLSEIMLFLK